MEPTIILVHGAFAESSSWDEVVKKLSSQARRVIAYANPLRSIAGDAAGLTELLRTIEGPIVLVGHSYGGAVITNVPGDAGAIEALVYVAGFALEAGESPGEAATLAPGGRLAETIQTVPASGGGFEVYIAQEKYHDQFCADLADQQARLLSVSQRPISEAALSEPSGEQPLWKSVPSWFIFGNKDLNIPAEAHRIMAQRAKAVDVVEIPGASHVVGMSHPSETAELIVEAAHSTSVVGV